MFITNQIKINGYIEGFKVNLLKKNAFNSITNLYFIAEAFIVRFNDVYAVNLLHDSISTNNANFTYINDLLTGSSNSQKNIILIRSLFKYRNDCIEVFKVKLLLKLQSFTDPLTKIIIESMSLLSILTKKK